VLKVRSDAKPDALAGRLEDLVTGQQRDFAAGHKLLDRKRHRGERLCPVGRCDAQVIDAVI